MHIFFSGIGGGGVGPLALIAKQAGYEVSGSDSQESTNTELMRQQGIDLYIGQTTQNIAAHHAKKPVDWFVFSSGITRTNPNHPEIVFAREHNIPFSLRDHILNKIITDKHLKLIGIAGTHGKSTTTAMVVWLFHCLKVPIGHSVGAKLPFAPMGQLQPDAEFFVYECDEFDNNFLAFHPFVAAITGIAWDHHEIFPTVESYQKGYQQFISQSKHTYVWADDLSHLELKPTPAFTVLDKSAKEISAITLPGEFNRQDAWLAVQVVHALTKHPVAALVAHIGRFPGLKQRMELIAPNLYSNYAHTPEKIRGGMLATQELARAKNQNIVVIYEPLTNRRQHYIRGEYKDSFKEAKKLYWVPTYLAREDPNLPLLAPEELLTSITAPADKQPAQLNNSLKKAITAHLQAGDLVVGMGASGSGSLDEWLRKEFSTKA